jgi:hypothetical protein
VGDSTSHSVAAGHHGARSDGAMEVEWIDKVQTDVLLRRVQV